MTEPQYYLIEEKVLEDVAKYAKGSWVDIVRSHPYHSSSDKVLDNVRELLVEIIEYLDGGYQFEDMEMKFIREAFERKYPDLRQHGSEHE